jgi:hypothetical protein
MASLHVTGVIRPVLRGAMRRAQCSACATLCALLVVLASATSQAEPASGHERPPAAAPRAAAQSNPAPYRLGNAARPFGWSTVIGDFNTDGTPDVAVADHVGRKGSGYQYRIDFSLSSERLDGLTFESIHDAVTITAADIDRDLDLDIVVVHPISGETVGIWLNDGHGHFTAADLRQVLNTPATRRSIQSARPLIDLNPFDVSQQRPYIGVLAASQRARAARHLSSSWSPAHHLRSLFALLLTAPRAPPIPSEHDLFS